MKLDTLVIRPHSPAFDDSYRVAGHAFDPAAGSFFCRQPVDALTDFYSVSKVQPQNPYPVSEMGQAPKIRCSSTKWQ